ncbi:tRNA U34 5-methylaminomethyl-2-thiouridine-forming methyltransferase MnmC [Dysgonomonadaceae bacterium PH5-43]|nr:tRNA U34 5-methylaminomethyl-2-thiouridine-forming methyltransferase MnmC [Dysgonomonadaceae bacterium PH5-43]
MQSPIVIQKTSDGSHTLYLPDMDEHYHSVNGAVQESLHVYINTAFNKCKKDEIRVLEMGFGTGLNALLTFMEAAKRNIKLHYTTLEKYPLTKEIISSLNYSDSDKELFEKIHTAEWNTPVNITEDRIIHKVHTDFNDYDYSLGTYDVVYYDAFAPDKQSEVWSEDLFNKIFLSMNTDGVLSTYCAKGEIRRRMQSAGFVVSRLPGPPGKREILMAQKN